MPAERPTRDAYVYWEQQSTRWADIDVYGHMNNAKYFELFDTVVNNQLIHATGVDISRLPQIGVVAEVSCRYFAEVSYPEPVELGVAAERVGRSSVVYRVGLFQGADPLAKAEGRFVHVYVDDTEAGRAAGRPSVAMPPEIRAAVEPLLRD